MRMYMYVRPSILVRRKSSGTGHERRLSGTTSHVHVATSGHMELPPEKRPRTASTEKIKFNLELKFASVHDKDAFKIRLNKIRDILTPPGSKPIHNLSLLLEMFDAIENRPRSMEHQSMASSSVQTMSFMRNSGE